MTTKPERSCIHWVVALRPEANPLIERFQMSLDTAASALFPIYRSKDGIHDLVISGPGKINAAAATGYLAGISHSHETTCGWVNFGIAGSGEEDFGRTFIASKISDDATGRSHFPPFVLSGKVSPERRPFLTVDQPCENYPAGGALVEMEAAGFYPVAVKSQTMEFCQCLKVVSDDPLHPIAEISRESVSSQCCEALISIQPWLDSFLAQIEELNSETADPPEFQTLVSSLRFSSTREHQLRRLLQQWRAKHGENLPELSPEKYPDAKTCLSSIRSQLWSADEFHKKLA